MPRVVKETGVIGDRRHTGNPYLLLRFTRKTSATVA